MAAGKPSRVHRQYKTKYRTRNRRENERGLSSRGDVTIWLNEEVTAAWTPPKSCCQGFRSVRRRFPASDQERDRRKGSGRCVSRSRSSWGEASAGLVVLTVSSVEGGELSAHPGLAESGEPS